MELSCKSFDVAYHPSKDKAAVDTLFHVCSSSVYKEKLRKLFCALHHTGFPHVVYVTKIWILPYSVEDIKEIINSCKNGEENNASFHQLKSV